MEKKGVPEIITDQILKQLDQGVVPWKQPWVGGWAANLVRKKEYRGINRLLLNMAPYSSRWWLTFKQVSNLGGKIRRGEKATPIVFYKSYVSEDTMVDESGDTLVSLDPRFVLRYYRVWNLEQTEGIEEPEEEVFENDPIARAEWIVENMPKRPMILDGKVASYNHVSDWVTVPPIQKFLGSEEYYSTLFHELVHSTMHSSRLARKKDGEIGYSYAKEELVAELGAAYLCGEAGISPSVIENQAAYIKHWRENLDDDPRLIIRAGAHAQKAFDYILNRQEAAEVAA